VTWRTVPLRVKEGTQLHATRQEAEERAQKVANKTGDWCAVEDAGDLRGLEGRIFYIHPNTTRRGR